MNEGFAYVCKGAVNLETVSVTERGAMVNALAFIWDTPTPRRCTMADVKEKFDFVTVGGGKIRKVKLTIRNET